MITVFLEWDRSASSVFIFKIHGRHLHGKGGGWGSDNWVIKIFGAEDIRYSVPLHCQKWGDMSYPPPCPPLNDAHVKITLCIRENVVEYAHLDLK